MTYSAPCKFCGQVQTFEGEEGMSNAAQMKRALELCESLYSREFVISLIDEGITPLEFNNYPRDPQYLLNLREKINAAIKAKL